jgi:hypothetical protein
MLHTRRWSFCNSPQCHPAPAMMAGARPTSASSSLVSPAAIRSSRPPDPSATRGKAPTRFAGAKARRNSRRPGSYEARRCSPSPDLIRPFETVLVPRFYRGQLVGFVQRQDHMAALRALAELDRWEEEQWKLSKLTR